MQMMESVAGRKNWKLRQQVKMRLLEYSERPSATTTTVPAKIFWLRLLRLVVTVEARATPPPQTNRRQNDS